MTEITSKIRSANEAAYATGDLLARGRSLFEMSALRSVAFFNWNSQSFLERWVRRAAMVAMTLLRPFAYVASRTFATRFLHSALRGITRDRFELAR